MYRLILITIAVLLSSSLLALDDFPWIVRLQESYREGDIASLRSMLENHTPVGDEELAAYNFYQSRLSLTRKEITSSLTIAKEDYPETFYGQKSILELAKISMLERNYQQSLEYLKGVDSSILPENDFYLAKAYLKTQRFQDAIKSAQEYITRIQDEEKKEIAYLLIVEAYIENGQYQLALKTLDSMRVNDYIVSSSALVKYKTGYCQEMLDRNREAIESYKTVIVQHPYTEYSFQAEKRLYDLTVASATKIDYSDLIPTETELVDRAQPTTPKVPQADGTEKIYIQVSAFTSQENALSYSQHLQDQQYENIVFTKPVGNQIYHVVAIGPLTSREAARAMQAEVKRNLNVDSFIILH
jgi:tetratricopeptide (TPR) repeat protein